MKNLLDEAIAMGKAPELIAVHPECLDQLLDQDPHVLLRVIGSDFPDAFYRRVAAKLTPQMLNDHPSESRAAYILTFIAPHVDDAFLAALKPELRGSACSSLPRERFERLVDLWIDCPLPDHLGEWIWSLYQQTGDRRLRWKLTEFSGDGFVADLLMSPDVHAFADHAPRWIDTLVPYDYDREEYQWFDSAYELFQSVPPDVQNYFLRSNHFLAAMRQEAPEMLDEHLKRALDVRRSYDAWFLNHFRLPLEERHVDRFLDGLLAMDPRGLFLVSAEVPPSAHERTTQTLIQVIESIATHELPHRREHSILQAATWFVQRFPFAADRIVQEMVDRFTADHLLQIAPPDLRKEVAQRFVPEHRRFLYH